MGHAVDICEVEVETVFLIPRLFHLSVCAFVCIFARLHTFAG